MHPYLCIFFYTMQNKRKNNHIFITPHLHHIPQYLYLRINIYSTSTECKPNPSFIITITIILTHNIGTAAHYRHPIIINVYYYQFDHHCAIDSMNATITITTSLLFTLLIISIIVAILVIKSILLLSIN